MESSVAHAEGGQDSAGLTQVKQQTVMTRHFNVNVTMWKLYEIVRKYVKKNIKKHLLRMFIGI